MPSHRVKVLVPYVVGPPPVPRSAAELATYTIRMRQGKSLLTRVGSAIWVALEQVGRSRARLELMAFTARCEALQPEFAKELRAFASRTK